MQTLGAISADETRRAKLGNNVFYARSMNGERRSSCIVTVSKSDNSGFFFAITEHFVRLQFAGGSCPPMLVCVVRVLRHLGLFSHYAITDLTIEYCIVSTDQIIEPVFAFPQRNVNSILTGYIICERTAFLDH